MYGQTLYIMAIIGHKDVSSRRKAAYRSRFASRRILLNCKRATFRAGKFAIYELFGGENLFFS